MGFSIFPAMSRLKFAITTRSYFSSMPSTEITNGENISVSYGNDYHDFISFIPPDRAVAFPLDISGMSHSMGNPVWRQLWNLSDFTIRFRWGSHLLSPIIPSPDIQTPMICCGPGGLGVICVHSDRRRLIMRGIGSRLAPNYDICQRAYFIFHYFYLFILSRYEN